MVVLKRAGFVAIDARYWLMRAPLTLIFTICFTAMLSVAGCMDTTAQDVEKAPEDVIVATDATDTVVAKNAVVDEAPDGPRILAMGDSMIAWHAFTKQSISDSIEKSLNEPVHNTAISGARILYNLPVTGAMGMRIENQYRKGDWDWVVLNGGGNDLWFGCGCGECVGKINKMISEDGKRGVIPMMVQKYRHQGAQVAWVGYMRSPGTWSPVENCRMTGNELEKRISKLAAIDPGVHYVSLADMVPDGDRSFHTFDMIHPSIKGSREIGKRVAAVIAENDTAR